MAELRCTTGSPLLYFDGRFRDGVPVIRPRFASTPRFGAVDDAILRQRAEAARVGHLATTRPDGRPHVVPCCFVLVRSTVYSAVDAKPKSTLLLQRLRNLA